MRRAILAGFVATAAMTFTLVLAFALASALGSPTTPSHATLPGPQQWLWALTHNPITAKTFSALPAAFALHLGLGIFWALLYAAVAERRLPGADWERGLAFAAIPYVLSLVVFLPAAGGGLFGLSLGAGPLPIIGNLVLHAVYGATLGAVYGRAGHLVFSESGDEQAALDGAERGAGVGLLIGLLGGVALNTVVDTNVTADFLRAVLWGLAGGAVGGLVGTFAGLGGEPPHLLRRRR